MPLSNVEKQARWRERHAAERQLAARLANLLIRRSRTEGADVEARLGSGVVVIDGYYLRLAKPPGFPTREQRRAPPAAAGPRGCSC